MGKSYRERPDKFKGKYQKKKNKQKPWKGNVSGNPVEDRNELYPTNESWDR